jgi:predicted nucleic acid-binding protein
VSGCVLDTDVVIAALDRRDAQHAKAAAAIEGLAQADVPLLVSLVNYAETLVRPAEDEDTLRLAMDALGALTPAIAVNAARHRSLNISLADGFALATAQAQRADVASFDKRVRRALPKVGLKLTGHLR